MPVSVYGNTALLASLDSVKIEIATFFADWQREPTAPVWQGMESYDLSLCLEGNRVESPQNEAVLGC